MRLPFIKLAAGMPANKADRSKFTRLSLRKSAVALAAGLIFAGGCHTGFNPENGFLDGSELTGGQPNKGSPLTKNILNNLDPTLEDSGTDYANATDVRPEDLIPTSTDYTIGKNDLIQVILLDVLNQGQETSRTYRISESGVVNLPVLNNPVPVLGLTEGQLESAIKAAYKDQNIIPNATVTVTVLEARGRTFSMRGAIGGAGEYQIVRSDFRLLDALITARDVTAIGVDDIFIFRKIEGASSSTAPTTKQSVDQLTPQTMNNHPAAAPALHAVTLFQDAPATAPGSAAGQEGRVVTIDGKPVALQNPNEPVTDTPVVPPTVPDTMPATKDFAFAEPAEPTDIRIIKVPFAKLNAGQLKYNLVIRPGDMIYIPLPVTGVYYMGGHVGRNGVYNLPQGTKITLMKAVISAGMLDGVADPTRTVVKRTLKGLDRQIFVRVDLGKIAAGMEPDFYLKADDEILIGTNALAPFLASIRNGFRISYGFGFLYDRNFYQDSSTNGTNQ